MTRILESLQSKIGDAVCEDHLRKQRIAALLHDIGHYPYSHLMEKIDWDTAQKYIIKKGQAEKETTSPTKKYPKHDRLGEIIITGRRDIREILKQNGIDPMEIAALVRGQHQTFPNLLNASLDPDRLDYLMRDSLNTGLPYGKVDLNYIVNNLELTDEGEIAVREKAKSSIEHMLMGRYFMFNTVYMHKTVFAFEEIVRKIVLALWEKKEIYESGAQIEEMASADSEEFLAFHDDYLDERIAKYADNKLNKKLAALCRAVKLRQPPKLVCEVSELALDGGNPSRAYNSLTTSWKEMVKNLAKTTQISEERWLSRDIKGPEFESLHPFVSLREAAAIKDGGEQRLRELVKVKKRSGEINNLLEDKSSVFHYMSRLTPRLYRVYVIGIDEDKANEIRARIKEWLPEEESR
jgi:hypothetical protein